MAYESDVIIAEKQEQTTTITTRFKTDLEKQFKSVQRDIPQILPLSCTRCTVYGEHTLGGLLQSVRFITSGLQIDKIDKLQIFMCVCRDCFGGWCLTLH